MQDTAPLIPLLCRRPAWLLILVILASAAPGQETETQPAATQPSEGPTAFSSDDVAARLARVEGDQSLPENTRIEAAGLYRKALDHLALAKTWQGKVEEYRTGRESVPRLLDEVRARLQQLDEPAQPSPGDTAELSLEELSRRLATAEAELRTLQDNVRRLDEEAEHRSERRTAIPDLLAAVAARQEAASRGLAEPPGANVAPQVQLARRAMLSAQRTAAQEEARAYQEELQFYDARSEVLTLRRDEARRLAAQAETRLDALRGTVAARREADATRQREQAEAELRAAPAVIRELAERNNALATEWEGLAGLIRTAEADVQSVSGLAETLAGQFKTIRSYSEMEEMRDLVGPLMRQQRAELSRLRRYRREYEQTRTNLSRAQLRVNEVDAENDELLDLPRAVAQHLDRLAESEPGIDLTGLDKRLEQLLAARLDTVRKLKRDYDAYVTDLIKLGEAQNRLLTRVGEMSAFIDEHVLWVRSTVPLHRMDLHLDLSAWPGAFSTVGRAWWSDVRQNLATYLFLAAGYLLFLLWQPRFRRDLRTASEQVSQPLTDRYVQTLQALLLTLAIALPVPLLLGLLAWRLSGLEVTADALAFELVGATARGLLGSGFVLLLLLFARHGARRYGLAISHFRWEANAVAILRRHLIWFGPTVAPLIFVVILAERSGESILSVSVGRLAFLLATVATVLFVREVFQPTKGALASYFAKRPTALAGRLRWPVYLASQLLLVGLGFASVLGYHYTALVLSQAFVRTMILTALVILVHAMALRWVFFTQRKLAIEEANRKRAEQAAEAPREGGAPASVEVVEPTLKIGAIGEQTRQLLTSFAWLGVVCVVWFSWADLLPAFSFLEEVQLWSYTAEAAVTNSAGEVTTATVIRNITLASVLLALLILAVSYVLARNIPGLLEIAVLRRLPLDTGARFAISAVSRYVITVAGLVLAFGTIGIGWSSVQWLVAAITVGLGFGLQEIFANFVSGLILLFERPIRIGDTVTVGNISGTVSRIRIRATTITDWDRKELVIPNKEFVTGQVVNWSLSDRILRLIIKVGIAYGSDTRRAKELLFEVARGSKWVLDQPKPHVWFWEFGGSSLNFELRVFVRDIDDWVLARDSLHFAIDDAFREAGIEIAFPQQDVHIRTVAQPLSLENARAEELPVKE